MNIHFKRELLIDFGIIVGSILFIGLGIYILSGMLSTQADKISAERTLITRKAAAIAGLASLKRDLPQAEIYKKSLDQILVSQDQLLDVPHWLDGLARGRRVALSFSFAGTQTQPSGNSPGTVPFSLDIGGTLDDLIGFVKDVEIEPPRFLMNLDGFSLNGSGSAYRITASGKVYFK